MNGPYRVLGITPATPVSETRQRYLELIQQYPPEQHPVRFAAIRKAFELVGTLEARTDYHLKRFTRHIDLDDLIKELQCRKPPIRPTLEQLVSLQPPPGT